MKLKDLLSKLSGLDPEQDVLCYCEDEGILPPKHGFRLFEINGVTLTEAEKTRCEEGIPSLKLGKTECSAPHVFLDITLDF
jgi:hypothetical protein